ncbi:MAG: TonB-dependent receptor [Rhizomicrobium sp.]
MKAIQKLLLCTASMLTVGSLLPAAYADGDAMETVVVTGMRESLRDSLQAKKNAVTITENISTKDIGALPDVTIAEELSRLPGFNAALDRGNASQASVRGLGPRLVFGLVNGREVASSEPDQNIRWEIYPSEVVSGVSVAKSQSADLVAGGIAATIDVKTVSPLDYSGPSLNLRAGPTYNSEGEKLPHYSPVGFRGSASYITHLTDNLAVYGAASFQREKNGYISFQGWGYNRDDSDSYYHIGDVTGDGQADYLRWGAQTEVDRLQQDRLALAGAVDWQPISNLRVKGDILYSDYRIHENQLQQYYTGWSDWAGTSDNSTSNAGYYTNWTNGVTSARKSTCNGWGAGAYGCVAGESNANVTTSNGVVVGGTRTGTKLYNVIALYQERHSLLVGGLNAEYTTGPWDFKADLSHSEAMRNNIWQDIRTTVGSPGTVTYYTGHGKPSVSFSGSVWAENADSSWSEATGVADVNHQTAWSGTGKVAQSSGPEYTRDHLSAMAFDGSRAINGSFWSAIDFGVRMSNRGKGHMNHSYYLCPSTGASLSNWCEAGGAVQLPADKLETFHVKGLDVPDMLYGSYNELKSIVYPNGTGVIAGSEVMSEHWHVRLDSWEGYVKADFSGNLAGIQVEGNLGTRIVGTFTRSSGYETKDEGTTWSPTTVSKTYTDVLPSLNINAHLTDEQILRFGASFAMARAPIDELRVGNTLSTTSGGTGGADSNYRTGTGGTPTLNPYRAKQIDLSYEWYFHDESLVAATVYYKHINSFIGYKTADETYNDESYSVSRPVNGRGGDVSGIELTLQSRFYFLPVRFLQDFGIYANYAYVNSGLKEYTPAWNPLDASGLAAHTAELDLWYSAYGVEARLAYKVHSPYTISYGWTSSELSSSDWGRNLDASLSYQVTDDINVRFQARNLTAAPWRSYWDNNSQETARYDIYGRSFMMDVSFHN